MSRMRYALVLVAVLAALAALIPCGSATASADACTTPNPPNTMTLVGGTPQTAKLHQPFDAMLAVALANTNGCPVTTFEAGVPVTFTAPASGPSGVFSASGSSAVTVGTNASGQANAPAFAANGSAGSYAVTASSDYGSVTFSLTNTASGIAASIAPVAPASQSATAGSRFAQPLQATVLDANGNPVDGATVTFALGSSSAGGGASTAGASFAGGAAQATALTGPSGSATSPSFTANTTAGTFTATAATAGVVEPAAYSLDNLAGKPPTITALQPAKQTATIGARYGKPLQVKLLDGVGNPLQGATVTFTLDSAASGGAAGAGGSASAGGSFADGSSQLAETTDASGIATSPRFSANTTAGRFTATAATAGTTAVVRFSLDNLAGKPTRITPLGPAKQSATTGARYRKPLRVKVRDGHGDPLQGATVTFTLGAASSGGGAGAGGSASAGGSFADGSSQVAETTNASGIATSPRFSANTTAGRFTATAATSGTADVATFSLDNRAGRAPSLTAEGKEKRSATVGARYAKPLKAKVRGANGKPLQGVSVTFTLGAGAEGSGGAGSASAPAATFPGGSSQATETTNAAGVATSPRPTANTTAGAFIATATTTGTGSAASFALHNLPGKPAAIAAGVAAAESTAAGTRFPIRLAVTVTDKNDNPVRGITVSFSAPAAGASGRFHGGKRTARVKTDAKGIAVAPAFVANQAQGGYVVRATAAGHAAAFALVNQSGG